MSGTKSPSPKAPATDADTAEPVYWTVRRLSLWFFVFAWGAVAINVYFVSLMWQAIGWPAIDPVTTIIVSFPLAFPATWLCAKWIRGLMDEAES